MKWILLSVSATVEFGHALLKISVMN